MAKLLGEHDIECAAVIKALRELPHTSAFACSNCGSQVTCHAMEIYATCSSCGTRHKTRGFGNYYDLQDVVGAALQWLSSGPDFERIVEERERYFPEDES